MTETEMAEQPEQQFPLEMKTDVFNQDTMTSLSLSNYRPVETFVADKFAEKQKAYLDSMFQL